MGQSEPVLIFSSLKEFYASLPKIMVPKVADLLAVSDAAASGADRCLKVHMNAAARAGASEDGILDATIIAAMIGQTRVLAAALREFRGLRLDRKRRGIKMIIMLE